MTEILTVIGTRPEIIKMSCLIPSLDRHFDHCFVCTGQHYSRNMSDVFFRELDVRKPDRFLNLKTSDKRLLVGKIRREIRRAKPEYVLVYGDTNTTLAGAVASAREGVKVIHVEAGFRSFDRRMTEERNRVEVDRMSSILFTPTGLTKRFLFNEGIRGNVFVVGDVSVDVCRMLSAKSNESRILERLGLARQEYVVFTAHRQENVDKPRRLLRIIKTLDAVGGRIVYPVHPRTRERLRRFRLRLPGNVVATEPLGCIDFFNLEKNSSLVITDSGGVQAEAFTLHVPCITIRESTERWETITLGANFLAGVEPLMVGYYARMIRESNLSGRLRHIENPYGDGRTSKKIAKVLKGIV